MKIEKHYEQQFEKSRQLKNWFSWFSVRTWNKLSQQSKWGEVTATETLVSDLEGLILNEFPRLPFRLFHAKNEPKNGNDLEIILPFGKDKYVVFPCQAKRIYDGEIYKEMKREGQIGKLIEYARLKGGYPIYLLYNFINDKEYIKSKYGKGVINPEELGCSIISAEFIYKTFPDNKGSIGLSKNPSFKDLHLPAAPLSIIADSMLPNFFTSLKKTWKTNPLFEPTFYTLKQIDDPNTWEEITTKTKKNMALNFFKNTPISIDDSKPFEPVFRILLTEPNLMSL
jgi:hypothetical protein